MSDQTDAALTKLASFDRMWNEDLSFIPGVPLDWKEREQWKSFAEQIYNRILDGIPIGEMLDKAYDEGFQDCQDNIDAEDED